ncbi:MAG: hypothetical protein WCF65_06720 [Parachlamydiaceae bacterium]
MALMKGPVQRDSFSRCETPSMLYDAVRHPHAKYTPPKAVVNFTDNTKDTMESTQQRLNREMLNRFQSKGLELPHESYVAVVQVGKYLFLAIMLPPYLCLYAFPQWLIFTKLPQLALDVKAIVVSVGNFVVELGKRVTDIMKGMMEQLIGDALKLAARGSKHLVGLLAEGINTLYHWISLGGGKLMALSKTVVNRLSEGLGSVARRVVETVSLRIIKLKEAMGRTASQGITAVSTFVSHSIYSPIAGLFTPFAAWSAAAAKGGKERMSRALESVSRWIKNALTATASGVGQAASRVAHVSKKYVSVVAAPVVEWGREAVEAVKKMIERVVHPLGEVAVSVQAHVIERFAAGIEAVKYAFNAVPAARTLSWIKQAMRGRLQRRQQSFASWGRTSKQLCVGFWSGVKELGALVKRVTIKGNAWFLQWLSKFVKIVLNGCRWVVSQVLQLPQNTVRLCRAAWKISGVFARNTLLAVRILIAMIWASSEYALLLIRRIFHTST